MGTERKSQSKKTPKPGKILTTNTRKRVAAKSVMGISAIDRIKKKKIKREYEKNLQRSFDKTIKYEWCHLIGHGDGGDEIDSNFVIGTNHCNTEQLAIEEGVRTYTQNEKYFEIKLGAKVTAYTIPGTAFTIARYIRYKIVEKDDTNSKSSKPNVIFEHLFDAQSQSFNRHEFRILKYTVVLNIAAYLEYTYWGFENEFQEQVERIWEKYNGTDISTEQIKNLKKDFFPADDDSMSD